MALDWVWRLDSRMVPLSPADAARLESSGSPPSQEDAAIILRYLIQRIEALAPHVPEPNLKEAATRISALAPRAMELQTNELERRRSQMPRSLVRSETLRMQFDDDDDEEEEAAVQGGSPGRGSIIGCEILLGESQADGGYAIETVFERRPAKALGTRLRDQAELMYYKLVQRNFIHPLAPDEDDDEEDKQEYWRDVRRVRRNRALFVLAVIAVPLAVALLTGLASFEGMREATWLAWHTQAWLSMSGAVNRSTTLASYNAMTHAMAGAATASAAMAGAATASTASYVLDLLEAVPISALTTAFRPEGLCEKAPLVEVMGQLTSAAPCRMNAETFFVWPE